VSIRVVAVLHDFLLTALSDNLQKLKFGDAINNCRWHGASFNAFQRQR
jgi:hypothetical protein